MVRSLPSRGRARRHIDSGGRIHEYGLDVALGLEGMAGFDFVLYRVAIGPHFRAGFTNRYWATAGLHVELRI